MVHTLTSEMSIIQRSPALPSSSCLCLLTKHVTRVHAPPSPCLAPPPINTNVATTLPLLPPSPIDPSSPLVSPAFPPQLPSSHPISTLKTNFSRSRLAGRSSKRSPPSTTVKDRVSLSDTRHLAARGASGIEVVGGTSSASGFYSLAFVCSFVFFLVLDLSPPFCFRFAPARVARFVRSIK